VGAAIGKAGTDPTIQSLWRSTAISTTPRLGHVLMKPTFTPTDDGLTIIDRIERHQYRLTTPEPVHPEPVDTDRLTSPVDAAVRITTDAVTLPTNDRPHIRDADGKMLEDVDLTTPSSLDDGPYLIELSTPFKIYLAVDSALTVIADADRTHITLEPETEVIVGVRSYHRQPATTITTTDEPTDVMTAVSAFGAALKTTTPDRSYPTLRGHPPTLERGEELHLPASVEPPATGITIEVPPTLGAVFVVTPLAYYLGAAVEPGPVPRLRTENGGSFALLETDDGPSVGESIDLERWGQAHEWDSTALEQGVGRLFGHVFLLDAVVRTEGSTPIPLAERAAIEPDLPFTLEGVNDASLPEQLERYLEVPFEITEPHRPAWRLEVRLDPTPESVPFLPFVADALALVTVRDTEEPNEAAQRNQREAIDAFVRRADEQSGGGAGVEARASDNQTRSAPSGATTRSEGGSIERSSAVDRPTITQRWRTEEPTAITSTAPLSAFHHSLGRKPRADPIEIEVVCNDPEMREELETVNGIYGDRDALAFTVNEHYNLSREGLRDVLADESDFVHYIGHIDDAGFQCADGKLPGESIATVGTKAFLLNACQSREQGLHLIDRGSIGGIVTLGDIINSGAINVGSTIARLLNRGYPLHAALTIAQRRSLVGQQYRLVGDGMTTIAQSEVGCVSVCHVQTGTSSTDADNADRQATLKLETYETSISRKGSLFRPYLDTVDHHYLVPKRVGPFHLRERELAAYLGLEELPVVLDGTLTWSTDIDRFEHRDSNRPDS